MRAQNADLGHTSQTSTAVIPSHSETPPANPQEINWLLNLGNASPRPGRRRTNSLSSIFNITAEGNSGDVVRTRATVVKKNIGESDDSDHVTLTNGRRRTSSFGSRLSKQEPSVDLSSSPQRSSIDTGLNKAPPIPPTLSRRGPSDFNTSSSNGGHVDDEFTKTRKRRRKVNKQDQGDSNSGGTDLRTGRRKSGKE